MKYFVNIKSLEELRKEYKKLAKKYHPDMGGDAEIFKAVVTEYEIVFKVLEKADTTTTKKEEKYNMDIDIEIRATIDKIINLDITIEIIGSWIWLSGNTFAVKETLKANGFIWANKKKMWSWHSPEESTSSRGKKSIDDIRNKYGSTIIKNGTTKKFIAC